MNFILVCYVGLLILAWILFLNNFFTFIENKKNTGRYIGDVEQFTLDKNEFIRAGDLPPRNSFIESQSIGDAYRRYNILQNIIVDWNNIDPNFKLFDTGIWPTNRS